MNRRQEHRGWGLATLDRIWIDELQPAPVVSDAELVDTCIQLCGLQLLGALHMGPEEKKP